MPCFCHKHHIHFIVLNYSTTSSTFLFSDLTFKNPIKTGNPVFWAWWRLETSGISSWRSLLCLVHLHLTFLPALFFLGSATSSDFCRFQDDLSLIGLIVAFLVTRCFCTVVRCSNQLPSIDSFKLDLGNFWTLKSLFQN